MVNTVAGQIFILKGNFRTENLILIISIYIIIHNHRVELKQ